MLDDDVAAEVDRAESVVQEATAAVQRAEFLDDPGMLDDARAKLDAAKVEAEAVRESAAEFSAVFTFEALSRRQFEALVDAHPPTKAQRDDLRKKGIGVPRWNSDSFPPALLAASCVGLKVGEDAEDGLTIDEAKELWASDRWTSSELTQLFEVVLLLCDSTRIVALKKG